MTYAEFVTLIDSIELSPRTKNRLTKYGIPRDAEKIIKRCVNAYDLLCNMDEITNEIRYFGDFGKNEVIRGLKKICGIMEDKPKISWFEKIKQMSKKEFVEWKMNFNACEYCNSVGLCSNYKCKMALCNYLNAEVEDD